MAELTRREPDGSIGHVFIARGDLTRLWCDAWLMPCDGTFEPRAHWYQRLVGGQFGPPRSEFLEESHRVRRTRDWPKNVPQPWLVDVGGGRDAPAEWFVEGVREWLDSSIEYIRANRVAERTKPLIAIPLVGTGYGGASNRAGQVVRVLLPVLYELTERHDVDIALITHDGPAYAAALAERARVSAQRAWPVELGAERRQEAERLATHARAGNLVLFAGAGVSMAAGLPGWAELLIALAKEARITKNETAGDAFRALASLDRARLVESRLQAQGGRTIGEAAAEFIGRHEHYALGHLFVSGLPARGAVTTNYDQLYENAASDIGKPVSVLPYQPTAASSTWLLKLHGCVTAPDDIVLTRADYLRYDQRRAALRGVVQAMLLTRHMLFVGFSMNDDNFHRIVDDVRRAVRGEYADTDQPSGTPLATTLSIENNPFFEELWSDDIRRVDLHAGDTLASARLCDIFLDYLAGRSAGTTSHLMDRRYEGVLSEPELEVRNALAGLPGNLSQEAKETEAWTALVKWLRKLGLDPMHS